MGDANADIVSLFWPDHARAFLESIWDFFLQKRKVDVELAYGGERITAHQLVLCVFSSTLREKLEASGQPWHLELDQVTKARGGEDTDFGLLIEFIYRGKVDICSGRLHHLKELAHTLGIQGLLDAIQRQESAKTDTVAWTDANVEETEKKPNVLRPGHRRKLASLGCGARKRKGRPVKITHAAGDPGSAQMKRTSAPRVAKNNSRNNCLDIFYEEQEEVGTELRTMEDDIDLESAADPSLATDDSDEEKQIQAQVPKKSGTDVQRKGRMRKNRSLKLGSNMTRSEYKRLWRQTQPFVKCPQCTYETRDKESLKKHLVKHDPNAQRFPCELCGKSFRNKAGLRCHLRLHGDPDQLHKCNHCSFQTPKKSSWVQHLAVIHRVDPQGNELLRNIACTDCDYTCVNDYQLKAHMMWKHTVDKPHKCPECPYAAVIKRDVDKHIRIKHMKERPYMCETCGFRSQTQGGHNRHVRSHSGVKPFKCEECGQAYADSSKLKIHRQKHTSDDKPFVCHLCGHACRRLDNLQMHLKRIHKTHADTDTSKLSVRPKTEPVTPPTNRTEPVACPLPPLPVASVTMLSNCQHPMDTSNVICNSMAPTFCQMLQSPVPL